ncbi:uncharacterized protein PHACADRAFT_249234 [Phanerochaete carnosa HHB-10118-sp]|uniref:Transcription initiation factor IIF subunit alpha n=1 Tax=Phanerochaete carnosa (strain HHB-10118-sp) TaxID=650164 RepID=K5WI61_PHACS|nr:uncharacterized protein PHACADRAFT_249234 [Phanerochaete carnosa HHB-10118-sp]EKM59055.1 hypothetical protein PHACADRAFT_249234 [Phanerochaete carnosa HHB-10118-sp]
MAPATSVLFHPKKKQLYTQLRAQGGGERPTQSSSQNTSGTSTPSPSPPSPQKPKPKVPRPPRAKEEEDGPPKLEGPFAEFRLMSSALNGWKYDVMKFDSRKPVDILAWAQPVKLNRKEVRRNTGADDTSGPAAPVAVGPMLGPDNKPVIGMDGRVVMVDAEGKPIRPGEQQTNGAGDTKGKEKEKPSAAKKKFQKKTRQVFLVPEHIRQLRREERYPWIIEDSSEQELWVASMEEVSKAETQAMFMPAANDIFKFVPAHRWYKFQKRPHYHVPNLEEAEDLMKQLAKNKDPERWLLRRRNGQGPSDATAAIFKAERDGSMPPSSSSLVYSTSQSVGPGGRKLRSVDSGVDRLFGDDDEEDGEGKRRKREYGQEGDLDELDFEDDVQDDDDKMEPDADDEEAKELEERLKREYKTANKTREGYIDESDEEEEINELSTAGKDMRKLMKKLEKNGAYDESDDEKNPYASSEEEEPEEEPLQAPQGPAIIPPEPQAQSRQSSQAPGTPVPSGAKSPTQPPATIKTESGSRATSPIPGHGGHAVVAQRATSPKAPKLKTNGTSRATSPLAGGSQPTSPIGSPITGRADSPPTQGKPGHKRKAEEGAGGVPSKLKKRKATAGPTADGELEDWMLVEWLKKAPNATTRDCIHHFTPWLTTEDKKQNFTKLVKEVAQLKGGVLVLRPAYRGSNAPNSPAPASPAPTSPTPNGTA